MSSDSELLLRFIDDRSQEAFSALVQRHLNLVFFTALRRTNGDSHLAEDVTQQVFATLAKNASKLQHQTVLTGWLYVATKHTAANALRGEKRRIAREQEAHAMQEIQNTRDPETDWNQLRPQLDGALDALNEKDRLVVLLRYFENRPFAEIGAVLCVSGDAARVRVDRALEKLRSLLVRRGITSTAVALGLALTSQSALAAPSALAANVTGYALAGSATAGGASTAAVAFKIFKLMSITKTLVATTSAIAILAVGTAVFQIRVTRQAQAALSSAKQEIATLRDREQAAVRQTAELQDKVRSLESARATPKTTSLPKTAGSGQLISADAQMEILLSDPEYQELSLRAQLNNLRFRYGPLYQRLGLTTQQIANFESAVIEQTQLLHDARFSAMNQGVALTDPAFGKVFESPLKAITDKLKGILGEDGYTQYDAFNKTATARSTADSLASSLYYTDTPLTADQANKLTTIVAANTTKAAPDPKTAIVQEIIDWNKVAEQTADIFQPEQQATLSSMIERDRVRKEMFALSKKLTNKAISSTSATKSP